MKKTLRLNSEKEIEYNTLSIKIGTIRRDKPEAIYIEAKGFISPTDESEDFDGEIDLIRRYIKKSLGSKLRYSKYFENRWILDFQLASRGIKVGKKSYFFMQITLRQKNEPAIPLRELKELTAEKITEFFDEFIDYVISQGFLIYKSKK